MNEDTKRYMSLKDHQQIPVPFFVPSVIVYRKAMTSLYSNDAVDIGDQTLFSCSAESFQIVHQDKADKHISSPLFEYTYQ